VAEYGGGFAAFLAGFAPARGLPYLADVARLEWTINECRQADVVPALDPTSLASVPQADFPNLRFRFHPACRLFRSDYPIDQIWLANQPDSAAEQTIDLASGGCRVLIRDSDTQTVLHPLDLGEYVFCARLAAGETLVDAYEAAAAQQPAFEATGTLYRLLRFGGLAGFATAPPPAPSHR
jgi:hypothetical protein